MLKKFDIDQIVDEYIIETKALGLIARGENINKTDLKLAFQALVDELRESNDVLFIGIGSSILDKKDPNHVEQCFPTYLRNFVTAGKKVGALTFQPYLEYAITPHINDIPGVSDVTEAEYHMKIKAQGIDNLFLKLFLLPSNDDKDFNIFHKTISALLKNNLRNGCKIYFGQHIGYLGDDCQIVKLYNELKQEFGPLVQLYEQNYSGSTYYYRDALRESHQIYKKIEDLAGEAEFKLEPPLEPTADVWDLDTQQDHIEIAKEFPVTPYNFFQHATLKSVSTLYAAAPEILQTQIKKIFMENAPAIQEGNLRPALHDLKMLLLKYHPDKNNGIIKEGYHELQQIVRILSNPKNDQIKEEILAVLDVRVQSQKPL